MIRLISVAFVLAVATSAQAMSPAPLHQPDGMITQVREACGAVGYGLMAFAWPEPPSARSAEAPGVWNGVKAFAVDTYTTETRHQNGRGRAATPGSVAGVPPFFRLKPCFSAICGLGNVT